MGGKKANVRDKHGWSLACATEQVEGGARGKVGQKHKIHNLSSIMHRWEKTQNTPQTNTYSRKFLSLQKCEKKKKNIGYVNPSHQGAD